MIQPPYKWTKWDQQQEQYRPGHSLILVIRAYCSVRKGKKGKDRTFV